MFRLNFQSFVRYSRKTDLTTCTCCLVGRGFIIFLFTRRRLLLICWSCCGCVFPIVWLFLIIWFVFYTQPLIYLFREFLRALWNTVICCLCKFSSATLACRFSSSSLPILILPVSDSTSGSLSIIVISLFFRSSLYAAFFLINCFCSLSSTVGNLFTFEVLVLDPLVTVFTLLAVSCEVIFLNFFKQEVCGIDSTPSGLVVSINWKRLGPLVYQLGRA